MEMKPDTLSFIKKETNGNILHLLVDHANFVGICVWMGYHKFCNCTPINSILGRSKKNGFACAKYYYYSDPFTYLKLLSHTYVFFTVIRARVYRLKLISSCRHKFAI
jgi:hypothetical protein